MHRKNILTRSESTLRHLMKYIQVYNLKEKKSDVQKKYILTTCEKFERIVKTFNPTLKHIAYPEVKMSRNHGKIPTLFLKKEDAL